MSLMIERLFQLPCACLQFVGQSGIFDCKCRLVGKALKDADLVLSKRAHLKSSDDNRADGLTIAEQRDSQYRAKTQACRVRLSGRELVGFC